MSDPTAGDLTIGASIAIAEGFVCSIITRLLQRYPRLRFQVHATDTATSYQDLLSRKVDLAIVHLIHPPSQELMNVEVLLQDPHVVIAGAENPLARRRRLTLAQLMDEPWVFPLSDQPYGSVVHEAFRAHGLAVPSAVVGSTLPLRTSLLMTGRFCRWFRASCHSSLPRTDCSRSCRSACLDRKATGAPDPEEPDAQSVCPSFR